MRFFEPSWAKSLLPTLKPDATKLAQLETLRREYKVPEERFAIFVNTSPIGIRALFEIYIERFSRKGPNQDPITIWMAAYAMMLRCWEGEPTDVSSFESQLPSVIQENKFRFFSISRTVKSIDDLVRYYILESGAYSDEYLEVRELQKCIDVILGWDGYAAFSHALPAFPKAPEQYTEEEVARIAPFITEIGERIGRGEPITIIAQDIGTRACVHPILVLDLIAHLTRELEKKGGKA